MVVLRLIGILASEYQLDEMLFYQYMICACHCDIVCMYECHCDSVACDGVTALLIDTDVQHATVRG